MVSTKCFLLSAAITGWTMMAKAQTAQPSITFYSQTEKTEQTMSPGDSQTVPAPLEISCVANIDPGSYSYVAEWRIYNSDEGETSPIVTRFDDDITYTLMKSGGYGVKLYVTFVDERNDSVEYASDPFSIVISESKLTCTDGLSPNDDNINDKLVIEYESIVKASGVIANRWGQVLHHFTLENLADGWDGKYKGEYVKDGAYLLHIDAVGSDGLHYSIKKAINVLKGKREGDSTTTY